jgi:hypothetical protein
MFPRSIPIAAPRDTLVVMTKGMTKVSATPTARQETRIR